MAIDADEVYIRGLHFFTDAVEAVGPDRWQQPSPCEGWRALDVLGHMGGVVRFGTALLRGEEPGWSIPDRPGDIVEGNPHAWWTALAGPARGAIEGVDLDAVMDSPRGPRSVREGLSFPAVDLFVHGWDLVHSVGREAEIPADVAAFSYKLSEPMPEEVLRGPGVFGPEVQVPDGATATQKLVAWMGRDPAWSPPA
ncbi:TIGR03086 family metal-binding protein [Tomitella fengzijianii]|uniref:TIGR03086 family protein n=1 Tax=Tomitella fengzijianii TaxID=2597660 RepID=A0A516X4W0_9ACTN|nr:TIGR03086 family metal-binding protein [Tomitella fengzijianii]QDQ98118.1 TIGR03086 family protein [Tomitella fengzijianii]